MSNKIFKLFCFSLLFLFISFQIMSVPIQILPRYTQDLKALTNVTGALKQDLDYGKIPLHFVPNEGQVHEEALYYANTSGYTLWITREGLVFDSTNKLDRDVSRFEFIGANSRPEMAAIEPTQHKVAYFQGNDRSQWKTGIGTSKAVVYRELFPHIDLKIYGIEQEIEYDFIVKPGGKASNIGFVYTNVEDTCLDEDGNLIIKTDFGELLHSHPVAYQMIQGRRILVEAEFKNLGTNAYGFSVGGYDKSRDLIIDPMVIVYSTYLGGSDGDRALGIAVDLTGAVYLTGQTSSMNFPVKNALYPAFGGSTDVFISKLSPDGKSLVYSTYLGGSRRDLPMGIEVDSAGAAYVAGITSSQDFPTVNPLQEQKGVADTFVAKIDASGTQLEYSTHLGGADVTLARGLAVDSKGSAYVIGYTRSPDFPTKKAFQKKYNGEGDMFLAKLNPAGTAWVYSTYIGGSSADGPSGIKVDAAGNVYICGDTQSKDFPIRKAFRKKLSGFRDACVLKLNNKGKKLYFSTFLGGSEDERAFGLDVDMRGNVYVTGSTNSPDFPVVNPLDGTYSGSNDMFVAKFRAKGRKPYFSTYLGGPKFEDGIKAAVAPDNTVYIVGYSDSKKFPTKDALFKKHQGNGDIVLFQISENGQDLLFATYFGGSEYDNPGALTLDPMGAVYIAGLTSSDDFPVKNAYQKNKRKASDVFVTKLIKDEFGSVASLKLLKLPIGE